MEITSIYTDRTQKLKINELQIGKNNNKCSSKKI